MLSTAAVVAVPALTIRALHGVGDRPWFRIEWSDLWGWLGRADFVDAISAIARLVALALAYYLLISTVLYLVSVVVDSRAGVRLLRPLTLPLVRKLADRVVAGSIAVGVVATPLIAAGPPPPSSLQSRSATVHSDYLPHTVHRITEDPVERHEASEAEDLGSRTAFSDRPTTPPPQPERESEPDAVRANQPGSEVMGDVSVTVRIGDHLWALAEARVNGLLGRRAFDHEIAPYWRIVVDENRSSIRSGDPDVIMPGERIMLPDPAPHVPQGSQ
jgi:hypothetical protein